MPSISKELLDNKFIINLERLEKINEIHERVVKQDGSIDEIALNLFQNILQEYKIEGYNVSNFERIAENYTKLI